MKIIDLALVLIVRQTHLAPSSVRKISHYNLLIHLQIIT
jgi:hypothetical protein